MGFKRQAIAALSIVSLLVTSIGLTNSASAEWAEDGSWVLTPGVTCAEAQNAINNASYPSRNNNYKEVRIVEDCSANLTIPSGKNIMLSLYSEYDDELGNRQQKYYNLSDKGGDTITVEEGATLFLAGSPVYDELPYSVATISNSTSGKSVINNHGTVRTGVNLTAENGAYLATNSGKLYTIGGVYTGGTFRNNSTGKTYIAMGIFSNVNGIQQYIVNGMKLDEGTGRVVSDLPSGKEPFADYPYILTEKKLPVGYSFTLSNEYADLADAIEMKLGYSDESILSITGSNQEGWTFTVVGAGNTCAGQTALYFGGDIGCMTAYVAPSNTIDTTESLTKYLVNKFFEIIRQAVESGKTISADVRSNKVEENNVDDTEKAEIAKVAGSDNVLGYYDVVLALNGNGEKLTDIHDLGNNTVEVSLPAADFVKDLETVKSGYKRNLYVVRYHNGVAEKLPATLSNDEIVFRSGKFSTYAVAYTDTKITTGGSTSGSSNSGTSGSSTTNSGSNTSNSASSDNINSTNSSNASVGAPDTGAASTLSNGGATVTIVGVVAISAIASGVYAYKVASRKERREK